VRFTLRWKILLLVVVAPLVLVAGSLRLVQERISRNVSADIDEGLHRSALVCRNVLAARLAMLESSARIVAQDPRFFAALSIPAPASDPHFQATVRGVAADFNRIARADIFEALDSRGRRIASVGAAATGQAARNAMLGALRAGKPVPSTLVEDGSLFFVSLTPVRAGGRNVGFLLLGARLGDDVAAELRSMTRAEVSLIASGVCSGTTLEATGDRAALIAALARNREEGEIGSPSGLFRLEHDGETSIVLAAPLPGSPADRPDLVVLQRSLARESAYLRDIQKGLAGLALVVLLATLVVGLFTSQRITTPILHLVRAAEGIEHGDYEVPLVLEGQDEVGYLARRFETMRRHERRYVHNLQEIALLKSKFIDVASHEIRTPTAVIKGYAELLARESLGPVTGKQREALEAIESSLGTIGRITENATWMAQLEGDRPRLDRSECEVGDLLARAVRLATAEAVGRRVAVRVDPVDVFQVEVDGPRLIQAVVQLVRNGIRFTPDGGSVTVSARAESGDLVIEVTDDGVGIPETDPSRLFERSVLVRDVLHHHSSTGLEFNSAGLGLGLPIARGIVEAHGGSLEVASRPGEGSTFTIRIPGAERGRKAA